MCKLTKYMSKFHISTQILQGNALFSRKIYTPGKYFTRMLVVTVATNFKSGFKELAKLCLSLKVHIRTFYTKHLLWLSCICVEGTLPKQNKLLLRWC